MQITRRQALQAGLITAALAAVPAVIRAVNMPRRPNIILLVTDDQRQESLGCYGNKIVQTPNIDALAARGVRFKESFTTTAICMSSRASILTGLYTRVHGIDDFKNALAQKFFDQSYPRLLKNAGYRTGFVGKWGIDGGEMPRGDYDYFQGYQGQGHYFPTPGSKHLTVTQTDQALEFLQGCKREQPFCLAVSFKAPHVEDDGRYEPGMYAKYPYDRALDHLYENDQVPPVKTLDATPMPEFLMKSMSGTREAPDFLPATYQEAVKDLYRLIAGVDRAVGKIVGALKTLGFDDNTVILYTADHGSFYGEHGFGGKWLMYEESIRTPMIVCDPRQEAKRRGSVCDQMVLNLDVSATVLDLAGISLPLGMQGKSMMPLVHGEQTPWRSEWFYEHHFRNQGTIAASEGIRTADWKYIRYIDTHPVCEHLFDLRNDPREEKNLANDPAYTDRLELLRQRWKIWSQKLDGFSISQPWVDPVV